MENFKLNVVGTEEFIQNSKNEIKRLKEEGNNIDEIIENVFSNFPKETKKMIYEDLKSYFK